MAGYLRAVRQNEPPFADPFVRVAPQSLFYPVPRSIRTAPYSLITNGSARLVRVVDVVAAPAAAPAFPAAVLPFWPPLESVELLLWAVVGGATSGCTINASTFAVAGAAGNVPSPRLGESDSPIGRENEGGRRSPPRDATAAASAARRACVLRAQSKFAKGLLEGGGGGGSEEESALTPAATGAAAARALPGNRQLEPTEASHACREGMGWVAMEGRGGRGDGVGGGAGAWGGGVRLEGWVGVRVRVRGQGRRGPATIGPRQ